MRMLAEKRQAEELSFDFVGGVLALGREQSLDASVERLPGAVRGWLGWRLFTLKKDDEENHERDQCKSQQKGIHCDSGGQALSPWRVARGDRRD